MSRYCGKKIVGPILEAGEHWKTAALIKNGSVFDSDSLWTPENLQALDQHFVNNLDMGEGSFYEKLASQLEPTQNEVKQLDDMEWNNRGQTTFFL